LTDAANGGTTLRYIVGYGRGYYGGSGALEIFGIRFVGITAENGHKLLLTLILFAMVWVLRLIARGAVQLFTRIRTDEQAQFWTRQAINLGMTLVIVLGLLSIWFNDPTRLATALGLITAGLAFALQRAITSIAGYFVILRGNTFSLGDRISMGGVRGDVIALGLIQTTIMEIGEPPSMMGAPPAIWVRSRQYSGRIVTVSNDNIFDEPVYNYTRDFPYLWEEITLPIPYTADRAAAEQIMREAAERHTGELATQSAAVLARLARAYSLQSSSTEPQVYYQLARDRLELTVRFVVDARGGRDTKDLISRDILNDFDAAGIAINPETPAPIVTASNPPPR
jgi:small-conductance mechanosensitive channel